MAKTSEYVKGTKDVKVSLPLYLVEHFKKKPGFKFSKFFTEKLEEEYLKEKTDIDVAKEKRKG